MQCDRCSKNGESLAFPPMGGQLGQKIQDSICTTCWQEWQDQQVILINHYGLQMADPDDRKKLIQAMKEFLGLETI